LRLNGREALPIETPSSVTCVPLMLSLMPATSGLEAQWQGRRDLFDARRLAGLARAYEELLRAAAAAPGRRLSTLPAPREPAVRATAAALLRR
jgi:non-ribosomal peptide synthetase component F